MSLEQPAIRSVQQLAQDNNKENISTQYCWVFVRDAQTQYDLEVWDIYGAQAHTSIRVCSHICENIWEPGIWDTGIPWE